MNALLARSDESTLAVQMELQDGRLSLCGERRDVRGGYSGGQLSDLAEQAAEIAAEPGGLLLMPAESIARLKALWAAWHLNDMRAGCEHQTGPDWDAGKRLEFRTYSVDWDDRRQLEREAEKNAAALGPRAAAQDATGDAFRRFSHAATLLHLLKGAEVKPFAFAAISPQAAALLGQHFELVPEHEAGAYRANPEAWLAKHRRRHRFLLQHRPPLLVRVVHQRAGHTRPTEHPEGFLAKPCPTCGYKYGTAWRRVEVPAEVIAELRAILGAAEPPPDPSEPYRRAGLSMTLTRGDSRPGWGAGSHHYHVTLERAGRRCSFPFSQGSGHTKEPTLADVVECLRSDDAAADGDENLGLSPREVRNLLRQVDRVRYVLGDACERFGFGGAR